MGYDNKTKVCKFGGTSMADFAAVSRVIDIVNNDDSRKFIVVSAPGKRFKDDVKITDALYDYITALQAGKDADFSQIENRFLKMASGISAKSDVKQLINDVKISILPTSSRDFVASRGEYLSAKILSLAMDIPFIDAASLIVFDKDGKLLLDASEAKIRAALRNADRAVIPGFYGALPNGDIKTFSRGGSDITGAIVASAISAAVYENWTDVDGFLAADPRVVPNARLIPRLGYDELRELSFGGAQVLHPYSVFPVAAAGVPINVRNTFAPSCEGTMIVPNCAADYPHPALTGVASKSGFALLTIFKNDIGGNARNIGKVLAVLDGAGASFDLFSASADSLSFAVPNRCLNGIERAAAALKSAGDCDDVIIRKDVAIVCAVGKNISENADKIFFALRGAGVEPLAISKGAAAKSITVCVDSAKREVAVRAIYNC